MGGKKRLYVARLLSRSPNSRSSANDRDWFLPDQDGLSIRIECFLKPRARDRSLAPFLDIVAGDLLAPRPAIGGCLRRELFRIHRAEPIERFERF